MDNIYKNIEEYNPNKKQKVLIAFDDIVAGVLSNEILNPIVTELFIRKKRLNIYLVFITQSYFAVPKNIRLNSTHCFVMKIPNKREHQQSHLIIHQILTFKTWKSVLQNHFFFVLFFGYWYYSFIT